MGSASKLRPQLPAVLKQLRLLEVICALRLKYGLNSAGSTREDGGKTAAEVETEI